MKLLKKLSKKLQLRHTLIYVLVYLTLLFQTMPQLALATPTGATVVSGSAGVTQSGNTTSVTMTSNRAVINWNSLDTASNEKLQFTKASGGFTVLNKVTTGGATQFNGTLLGNKGHIIIVNPNGIVFGSTAVINAFKFTASGLNIDNTDFMNGIYQYSGGGGLVTNNGTINAQEVRLIGSSVLNKGSIIAPAGLVIMAAGNSVYLGEEGSDVVVQVAAMSDPANHTVTNTGSIGSNKAGINGCVGGKTTEGPAVILAAGDIFSTAISGIESLRAEAQRNISFSGNVSANSSIDLSAGGKST